MKTMTKRDFDFSGRSVMATPWTELKEDTMIERTIYAKGSRYKAFGDADSGSVAFHKDTLDARGQKPEKLFIKF